MVAAPVPHRLLLRKVSGSEWRIENVAYAVDDSRRLLACIYDAGGSVDVAWSPGIALTTHYSCAQDALADITLWLNPVPRNTAPTPIPHFAPARRIA